MPRFLGIATFNLLAGMFGIGNNRNAAKIWDKFAQQLEPLAIEFGGHEGQAGHVPARSGEAFRKTCGYGITTKNIDDWRFQLKLTDDFDCGTLRHDKINGQTLKIGRKFWHTFNRVITVPKFNR